MTYFRFTKNNKGYLIDTRTKEVLYEGITYDNTNYIEYNIFTYNNIIYYIDGDKIYKDNTKINNKYKIVTLDGEIINVGVVGHSCDKVSGLIFLFLFQRNDGNALFALFKGGILVIFFEILSHFVEINGAETCIENADVKLSFSRSIGRVAFFSSVVRRAASAASARNSHSQCCCDSQRCRGDFFEEFHHILSPVFYFFCFGFPKRFCL